jgi:hypothetical protein
MTTLVSRCCLAVCLLSAPAWLAAQSQPAAAPKNAAATPSAATPSAAPADPGLEENLTRRLEPWGVRVERAGFNSIRPSPRTMRVTQLAASVVERERMLALIEERGVPRLQALALLGTSNLPMTRTRKLQRIARLRRRGHRITKLLDEAFAAEALDPGRLPLRWRGIYEERAYQGEDEEDPRKNLLIKLPQKKPAAER